jgi:GNAT superfamily N-acetyltransferase
MQVQRMVQRQAHSTQREGVLAAIGGITIDPIVPDALRMRRFYVRPAFRRTGIRGEIAQALLKSARSIPLVTLKCRRQECSVLENSGVRATKLAP